MAGLDGRLVRSEGTAMTAFATHADLAARWRPLSTAEQAQATVLLGDASAIVRAEIPTVDARILAATLDADLVKMVVCGMVKRAMIAADIGDGVSAQQQTAGPFAQSQTFLNPMGNLYLTKQDRRILGDTAMPFMIDTAPADSGAGFVAPSWWF